MSLILSGTDGLSDVDGSAATPAIRGTDANTGIFFPAADTIAFAEGGVEAARFDSSGNFGLGVTPNAWGGSYKALQFSSGCVASYSNSQMTIGQNFYDDGAGSYKYVNTASATRYLQSGLHYWYVAASGTAGSAITWTQAMTLDTSGKLFLGTTSTGSAGLNVSADCNGTASANSCIHVFSSSTAINGNNGGRISFSDAGSSIYSEIVQLRDGLDTLKINNRQSASITFGTNNTERARIDSSGNLLVGKTAVDFGVAGVAVQPSGVVGITRSGGVPLIINRLASDGDLVNFQQDGTLEGSISVSGTTVSYNGGHLSRWAQTTTAKDESLVKGTVLSNLDEMNVYADAEGNPVANEQLNKVKVSDVEGDVNVAGVFVNWSYDEQHSIDEINMAMTGDMIIRIAQGTTVQRGDLLMSAGDGTAKPQGDDIVRSKTVAKVTSNHVTCTYEDGSYCVPCVLMAC